MLAIEPGSHSRGDEELRAVATKQSVQRRVPQKHGRIAGYNLRVRTSVGHGEDTLLVVLAAEVLVGKFVSVNRATTSALSAKEICTY